MSLRTVSFKISEDTYKQIKDLENTSEWLREAVNQKLDDDPNLEDRVEELEAQVEEIRSALIREAGSGYNDYTTSAGDSLDEQ